MVQTVIQQVPVVHTVIQSHTVVVNDLKHVLNLLIQFVPTGMALSFIHYVIERDRLSASQNRLIATVYSVLAAVVLLTLNHTLDLKNLLSNSNLEMVIVAFTAVAGSAQKMFEVLNAVASAQPAVKESVVSPEGTPVTQP